MRADGRPKVTASTVATLVRNRATTPASMASRKQVAKTAAPSDRYQNLCNPPSCRLLSTANHARSAARQRTRCRSSTESACHVRYPHSITKGSRAILDEEPTVVLHELALKAAAYDPRRAVVPKVSAHRPIHEARPILAFAATGCAPTMASKYIGKEAGRVTARQRIRMSAVRLASAGTQQAT